MNYVKIPAKLKCTRCGNFTHEGGKYCPGCGVSFVLGQPDKWVDEPLSKLLDSLDISNIVYKDDSKCLWDDVPPGQPMGMVCSCPKCAITSATYTLKE